MCLSTNKGQVDITVIIEKHVYVIEIKLIEQTQIDNNPALEQIQSKGYSQKYINLIDTVVHEVGMVFSKNERNIIKCNWRNP
ncbi:MAG: PD-(D/E)XK nuclease domain-containing protein [Desulfamplus sp.]|nr:PD-(D/E)XK nuclease domain-containing protein [Desulfamplus sp.]